MMTKHTSSLLKGVFPEVLTRDENVAVLLFVIKEGWRLHITHTDDGAPAIKT